MSRLFIDGFEHGDEHLWVAGTVSIIDGDFDPHFSNYALRLENGEIKRNIPESSVICIGLSAVVSSTQTLTIKFYTVSGDIQGYVSINSNWSSVSVHNDTNTDSDSHYFGANANWHIQIRFENITVTQKRVQVDVNGFEYLDYTFDNDTADKDKTGIVGISGTGIGPTVDNVIIDDANLNMYPNRIVSLIPSSDSDPLQWVPVSGESHHSLVDEIPLSNYDFVVWNQFITADSAAIDVFEMTNLERLDIDIRSVQLQVYGSTGHISGETYKSFIRISGEYHYGHSGEASGANYRHNPTVWDMNPQSSGEWTVEAVQNLEAGIVFI